MNKHANTTAATDRARAALDPVVIIGRDYASAECRYQELESKEQDARAANKHSAELYYRHEALNAYDELCAIRDTIPHRKASSYLGALVQLNHAQTAFGFLLDDLPEGAETFEIKRYSRAITKCLFSVIDVIEQLSGVRMEDALHPDNCHHHQNPWVPVEDRCIELQGGEA